MPLKVKAQSELFVCCCRRGGGGGGGGGGGEALRA